MMMALQDRLAATGRPADELRESPAKRVRLQAAPAQPAPAGSMRDPHIQDSSTPHAPAATHVTEPDSSASPSKVDPCVQ